MEDSFEDLVDGLKQQIRAIGYEDVRVEKLSGASPQASESEGDPAEEGSPDDPPGRYVILVDAVAGPDFVLLANEDERYVEVQSNYALWRDIADNINETRAKELVPDELREDIPEDHPIRTVLPPDEIESGEGLLQRLATMELLNQVDIEVRREIVYQLSEIFTNAEVKHVVDSPTDTAAPHGFTVYYKIFPYEDEFGLRELNDVVERVRMATHRATLFLRYTFNLGVDITRTTAGDVHKDPDPPTRETDSDLLETGFEERRE